MGSLETVKQATEFLRSQNATMRNWNRYHTLLWMSWFYDDNRLLTVESDGKVVGVACARCLASVEDHMDDYEHQENGPVVWLDWVAARPGQFKRLIGQIYERFGDREMVAFTRSRESNLRIHKFPYTNWKQRFINGRK